MPAPDLGIPTITAFPGQPTWPVTPLAAFGTTAESTIDNSDPQGYFWAHHWQGGPGHAELYSIKSLDRATITVVTDPILNYPYVQVYNSLGEIHQTWAGVGAFGIQFIAEANEEYIIEVFQGNVGQVTTYTMTVSGEELPPVPAPTLDRLTQWLTLFEDDDVTPIKDRDNISYGAVSGSTVLQPTFSTHILDPRPYLIWTDEGPDLEFDPLDCTSTIGSLSVRVVDKRRDPADQDSGLFTWLLAAANNKSKLKSRRALLEQFDKYGRHVVINAIITGVELEDDKVTYKLQLKDMRQRERDKRAFVTAFNWGLIPQGYVGGWGDLGNGKFLIPDPAFVGNTAYAGSVSEERVLGSPANQWGYDKFKFPGNLDGLKQAMAFIAKLKTYGQAYEQFDDQGNSLGYFFSKVQVKWRLSGTPTVVHTLTNMKAPNPTANVFQNIKLSGGVFSQWEVKIFAISIFSNDPGDLPIAGASTEWKVISAAPPSADNPFFFEGTLGELAYRMYRGDYSYSEPGVSFDAAAMLDFRQNTPKVRGMITAPVDDMFSWISDHVYRAAGWGPAIGSDGRIKPVRVSLPTETEPIIDVPRAYLDTKSSWAHPPGSEKTIVITKYKRFFLRDKTADDETPLQRLSVVDVDYEMKHADSTVIGALKYEISSDVIHDVSSSSTGEKSKTEEVGEFIAKTRYRDIINRWLDGSQRVNLVISRSMPQSTDIQAGSWMLVDMSWAPEYNTGKRGFYRLMQATNVKLRGVDRLMVQAVDSGVAIADPAVATRYTPPTLTNFDTTDSPRSASVDYGSIPAGAYVVVEFTAVDPGGSLNNAGWSSVASSSVAGTATAYNFLEEKQLFFRARNEGPELAPSEWVYLDGGVYTVAAPSLISADAAYAGVTDVFAEYQANPLVGYVRVYYHIYGPGGAPLAESAPPVAFVDMASDAEVLAGIVVPVGSAIQLWFEPRTAGHVPGTLVYREMPTRPEYNNPNWEQPTVTPSFVKDLVTEEVTVELFVEDPANVVTKIEYRYKNSGDWSAYEEDISPPDYAKTFDLDLTKSAEYGYRVTGYNQQGIAEVLIENTVLLHAGSGFVDYEDGALLTGNGTGDFGTISPTGTPSYLKSNGLTWEKKASIPTVDVKAPAGSTPGHAMLVQPDGTSLSPGPVAAGGGVSNRATLVLTTPFISAGGSLTGSIALPAGVGSIKVYKVVSSAACRVRLYSTTGRRDNAAEIARPFLTHPGYLGAVEADWQFDTSLGTPQEFSTRPVPICANGDTPAVAVLYWRVENHMDQSHQFEITITYAPDAGL